jgi:hypothetical protein
MFYDMYIKELRNSKAIVTASTENKTLQQMILSVFPATFADFSPPDAN